MVPAEVAAGVNVTLHGLAVYLVLRGDAVVVLLGVAVDAHALGHWVLHQAEAGRALGVVARLLGPGLPRGSREQVVVVRHGHRVRSSVALVRAHLVVVLNLVLALLLRPILLGLVARAATFGARQARGAACKLHVALLLRDFALVGLVLVVLLLLVEVLARLRAAKLRVADAVVVGRLVVLLLLISRQLRHRGLQVHVVVHVVDRWLVELRQQVGALLELHGRVAPCHLLAGCRASLHLCEALVILPCQRVHLGRLLRRR